MPGIPSCSANLARLATRAIAKNANLSWKVASEQLYAASSASPRTGPGVASVVSMRPKSNTTLSPQRDTDHQIEHDAKYKDALAAREEHYRKKLAYEICSTGEGRAEGSA